MVWAINDPRQIFPKECGPFAAAAGRKPRQRLIDAFYERITHPDPAVQEQASTAWFRWDEVRVSPDPKPTSHTRFADPGFWMVFASLVIHCWKHAAFLGESGILSGKDRIAHIHGVLIHGKWDVNSPLKTAWDPDWR